MFKKTVSIDNGFTLWEVLLVVVLSGMIAFIAIPRFIRSTESVKSEVNKANLLKIERAIKLYHLDVGEYPKNLEVLVEKPKNKENWRGPYLEEIPKYPKEIGMFYEVDLNGKVIVK